MPLGASGRHWMNPKQMEHHGDMPGEGSHPMVHHIEIHPHGESSEHPHHAVAVGHDGNETHLGEHANYDEAANAGKMHMDSGGDTGMEEEQMEESHGNPKMSGKIKQADSGGY